MPGIDFRAIADAMTAEQFARHELQMHGNRAKCPWCDNPQHYNLAFYAADGKAHCHKCGRTVDVVGLAAKVWNTNQLDAARQLNDVYQLGVTAETMTQAERERREQARQRERQQHEAAKQAERAQWSAAADDLRKAEQATAGFTLADADNPATWAAVARLGAAQDKWYAMCSGIGG